MSIIATAVRHLMAAGVTGEALIAAIADMEAAAPVQVDEAAERRRAYDRERKRNAKRNSTGIPPESAEGSEDPSLSRPLSPQTPLTPTHTHPDIIPARKGRDFPMLDCTDADTWADFLRNRKAKRLPNTASAHRKLESDLADISARTGWPPGEVFAACVAKGWGAIYDPRDTTNDRTKQRPSTARAPLIDIARTVAADMEREAQTRAGY